MIIIFKIFLNDQSLKNWMPHHCEPVPPQTLAIVQLSMKCNKTTKENYFHKKDSGFT